MHPKLSKVLSVLRIRTQRPAQLGGVCFAQNVGDGTPQRRLCRLSRNPIASAKTLKPQRSVSAARRRANPSRIFDCRPRDSSAALCNRSRWKFNSRGSLGAGGVGGGGTRICNLGRLLSTWSKYANKSHLKCFQLSGMTTPGGAVHTKR